MSDDKNRQLALDPTRSFIVQAPAGSGKTELLTQRFLKLLAHVDKAPEEILAVTFTRKAAAQMRQRIIGALQFSLSQDEPPQTPHERTTWQLGRDVLLRDKKLKWDLIQYPNRLRIVTIDALCSHIVNRMPVLSHLGGNLEIVDFADEYYRLAVERLLTQTTFQENWANALSQLLTHQDNRITMISKLLVHMLGKRDQWLPYLGHMNQAHIDIQEYLNDCIGKIIEEHLQNLHACFDSELIQELVVLLPYAAYNCKEQGYSHPLNACYDLSDFPEPQIEYLPQWLGLVELLLTKEDTWRKSYTIKTGFPSQSETKDKTEKILRKERKDTIMALVNHLSANVYMQELLAQTRMLPPCEVSEDQSVILKALGELLPVLVAHLQVIFQEKGKVDFIEVNLRALQALGDELQPTDIALSLDYQLRHILIDEYQDTSVTQYRLFEKCVMGWQPGDGRTLFLVGDPMQSIYKFRGAEVSLFIQTQSCGLGNVKLTPITLQMNFRSSANVISWINEAFVSIFPESDDRSLGGVSYSKAIPHHPFSENEGVFFHPVDNEKNQSSLIVKLIQEHLLAHPDDTIGVLVRAKKHLAEIIKQLKPLSIPFVAHEVEHLAKLSHVIDLMSLLRAITDWSDNVAWYAILRAPWVGLSLADLLAIANATQSDSVWKSLLDFEKIEALSEEGRIRLQKFVPLLQFWFSERQRQDLSQSLRGLWIALGGPQCYTQPHFLNDIDKVLALIKNFTVGLSKPNIKELEMRLSELYADISNEKSGSVELMTIHKSKGLEFDLVIMPQLQTKTVNHEQALLLWFERSHREGIDLILAPRRSYQEESDPLYRFVEQQIKKKSAYETARLLYVGATRAKKKCHLMGVCSQGENGEINQPSTGSFLRMLWPHLSKDNLPIKKPLAQELDYQIQTRPIMRLPNNHQLPDIIQQCLSKNMAKEDIEPNVPQMSDIVSRSAGTIFHRLLQRIANGDSVDIENGSMLALKRMGFSQEVLHHTHALVKQGLDNILSCPKGQWILDPNHLDRRAEWQLSMKTSRGIDNVIIDYAFVDDKNTRWIVDYKLTNQKSLDDKALQEEVEKYRSQLEKYRKAVYQFEKHTIRCGLYFPIAKVWYEYE